MKTLIAIPCMDTVPVQFMQSLLYLDKTGYGEVSVAVESGSLIYDSRNLLLHRAIEAGVDRMLWFDSDMQFEPDVMQKLFADLDAGCDVVSGLYFKRRSPYTPVIYSECCIQEAAGLKFPTAAAYLDYPKDELFEVQAFGFGCVAMNMDSVRKAVEQYGQMLFMPTGGFGEDLSFCMRARFAGLKLWCDSRVKAGHVGYHVFDENSAHLLSNGG